MDNRFDLVVDCLVSKTDGYSMRAAPPLSTREGGIETVLDWIQQFSRLRQFKWRGLDKASAVFGLHVMAYNLIRLSTTLRPAKEVV